MTRQTDLLDGRRKKLLHIAPEPQMSLLFRRVENIEYLSADLCDPRAMVRMDITDIHYPDDTFDIVYCSHVLEHIPDDRKAMRELHRVLRPGGWAILQVPIASGSTFEDRSVTNSQERERLFGQHDHVRRYGLDYQDRLREAGFDVTIDGYARGMRDPTIRRFGLDRTEDIFLCH